MKKVKVRGHFVYSNFLFPTTRKLGPDEKIARWVNDLPSQAKACFLGGCGVVALAMFAFFISRFAR